MRPFDSETHRPPQSRGRSVCREGASCGRCSTLRGHRLVGLQGSLKVDLEVAHEAQADFFQAYEYARQQVWTGAVFLAVWG